MNRRPLHPVLARVTLALLPGAFALDVAGAAWGGPFDALAVGALRLGLLVGLAAVVAGVYEIYVRDIPGPALRVLLGHAAAMHVGWIVFLVSLLMRSDGPAPATAIGLGFVGTILMVGGALLGEWLVARYRVGFPSVARPL